MTLYKQQLEEINPSPKYDVNLCVANEPPDELQQLPDDVEVAVLARLVQRTLALLVLGLRVAAVLQQRAQHHQVASRGRDVHRSPGTEQRSDLRLHMV